MAQVGHGVNASFRVKSAAPLNSLNSYHLVSSFPPTAVADVLGEGDKVVVGLVA